MKKEVFIEAVTAGGDSGKVLAERLFEQNSIESVCSLLDHLLVAIKDSDTPVSDTEYCIGQLQAFLNVINKHHDD